MENNTAFKIGDSVKLKSGDTKMTIVNIDGEDIHLKWQVKGIMQGEIVNCQALEKWTDDDKEDKVNGD